MFYSVGGIGSGHWGLREFDPLEHTVDITQDDDYFSEGKAMMRQHIVKERNPRLIRAAKERFKQVHGRLFCEICLFDFERTYGTLGAGFIEAHHKIPVSTCTKEESVRIDDLAMVCSNCHSMLHRKKPWPNIDELDNFLCPL